MRLAIIVPYRDRRDQLDIFLPHMYEFLKNKQIDYKIFVAEQSDDRPFNYGKLCNSIVTEIKDQFDYFCFHDIDVLPTNDDTEYYYTEQPTQIFGGDLPYEEFFGGAVIFPKDVFEKINGYSNDYWGKGYIDLDLLYRCTNNGVKLQKRYDYSNKELFGSDLKIRDTGRYGSKLVLLPNSQIKSDHNESFKDDFTISFFYHEDFTPEDKNVIFRTLNGFDFQIFTCLNQMIIQFFDSAGKLTQIDIKNIDLGNDNHYVITHNNKRKTISVYYNGILKESVTYNSDFKYSQRIMSIGDADNKDTIYLHDFKLFKRSFNKIDVRKEYYYGIESEWLDLGKPCLFGKESVLLDMNMTLWRVNNTVSLNDKVLIKKPTKVHLPNRKSGKFSIEGFKFENLLDTYDPDIIENKLTYLDLLDGKINTEKYGLNSIKYTLLNNTQFDEYTEWYKIVT